METQTTTVDPVATKVSEAIVWLLLKQPFYGILLVRMDIEEGEKWCKTAATDGRKIYYNREFIKSLSPEEIIFLMAHELYHCIFSHFGNKGGRDGDLMNMAADYLINYTLVDNNIGKMPRNGLYDRRFTDSMSSYEIYEILKKNSVEIKMPLDQHLEISDGDPDSDDIFNSDDGISIQVTDPNKPPTISKKNLDDINTSLKSAIIQISSTLNAGKIPAGIKRMISDWLDPVIDWRILLDAHVRSMFKSDFSFMQPNRRNHSSGVIFPGHNIVMKTELDIFLDASGSIDDEMIKEMLSEVRGITESFSDFTINVYSFDTEVYKGNSFTPENIHEIDDFTSIKGGGGTSFECIFDYLIDQNRIPNRLVIFTDGYPCSGWGDPLYCETLWIINNKSEKIVAPYGITAYYHNN